MVAVDMDVSKRMDEIAGDHVADLCDHHGQEGVACDVERNAEEDVGRTLVQLAGDHFGRRSNAIEFQSLVRPTDFMFVDHKINLHDSWKFSAVPSPYNLSISEASRTWNWNRQWHGGRACWNISRIPGAYDQAAAVRVF